MIRTCLIGAMLCLLLAVCAAGCLSGWGLTYPEWDEMAAWFFSDHGPISTEEVVSRYPQLDGVVITAPEYMAETERRRLQRRRLGEPEKEEYKIQVGAYISVLVIGEGELTVSFTVPPDGVYDYPYLGPIKAVGLTVREFKQLITERLKTIIRYPYVHVNISAVRTLATHRLQAGNIVVLGAGRSGTLNFMGDETIIRVLAAVGGMPNDSEWRQVRIIREEDKRPRIILVDYFALVTWGDLRQNVPIRPNDIIFIPGHLSMGDKFEQDVDYLTEWVNRLITYDEFRDYFKFQFGRNRSEPED